MRRCAPVASIWHKHGQKVLQRKLQASCSPDGVRPPPLAPPGVRSLAASMYTCLPSISVPLSSTADAAALGSVKLTCAKPRGRPSSPYAAHSERQLVELPCLQNHE